MKTINVRRSAAVGVMSLSLLGAHAGLSAEAAPPAASSQVVLAAAVPQTVSVAAARPPVTTAVQTPARTVIPAAVRAWNTYGCVGLLNTRQWQVAVFALGYCPSVWVLQNTSWGRSVVNWIVNGLCRIPWVVRVATGWRYSSC